MNSISALKTLKIAVNRFLLTGFALFAVILMITGIAGCSGDNGSTETAKAKAIKEAEKSPLEISGIRTEVESLMKAAMAIPKSDNGWVDYEKASLELEYDEATDPQLIVDKGVNKENLKDVKTLMDSNASVLKLVEQGYNKSLFQPYMDYEKGLASRLPNFLKLRRLAFFLTVAGDYELSQGNEKQAAICYMQCMKMGQGMGNNGSLIFGMIGIAIERIGMKPLKALLNRENVGAETCAYVSEVMEKLEKKHFTVTELLDGEMIYVEYSFNDMLQGEFDDEFKECQGKPEVLKKEMAEYEQWYLEAREAVKGSYRDSLKKIAAVKTPPENTLIEKLVPNIEKAYKQHKRNRTELRGILLLSALKEYRAVKGDYPGALNDLSPDFINGIPEDSFSDDNQFIYKVESGKAILYSVGPDENDDGGRQAEDRYMENGDLVFAN